MSSSDYIQKSECFLLLYKYEINGYKNPPPQKKHPHGRSDRQIIWTSLATRAAGFTQAASIVAIPIGHEVGRWMVVHWSVLGIVYVNELPLVTVILTMDFFGGKVGRVLLRGHSVVERVVELTLSVQALVKIWRRGATLRPVFRFYGGHSYCGGAVGSLTR